MASLVLNQQKKIRVPRARLEEFVRVLGRRLRIEEYDFAILLTGDRRIRGLNRQYRHQDKPTDVLSFPSADGETLPQGLEEVTLGDIVISVDTAQRQARERGHGLEKELKILVLHGLLHLLGYDHEIDRGEMRRKELRLRKELLGQ
jgi:probable rRNA maturation factor